MLEHEGGWGLGRRFEVVPIKVGLGSAIQIIIAEVGNWEQRRLDLPGMVQGKWGYHQGRFGVGDRSIPCHQCSAMVVVPLLGGAHDCPVGSLFGLCWLLLGGQGVEWACGAFCQLVD